MPHSDTLFGLIKSLSKAEKRNVKLDMAKYKSEAGKDYVRLFDVIERQEAYNETAIKKKFANEPYFRQLSKVKEYLQKQIFKTLRGISDDKFPDMKISAYLSEINLLYKKKLFEACAGKIKKAKAYAHKYEKFPELMKLIDIESRVALHFSGAPRQEYSKDQWLKEKKDALKKYEEITGLMGLWFELSPMMALNKKYRSREDEEFVTGLLSHPAVSKKCLTFEGETIRLMLVCIHPVSLVSYENKYAALNNLIKHLESQPHRIDESPGLYTSFLMESAIISIIAKKYIKAGALIEKANNFFRRKKDEEPDLHDQLLLFEIETYFLLEQGAFTEALLHLSKVKSIVETKKKELNVAQELFAYQLFFNVYLKNSDFKNAQHYIQKIINYRESDVRLDIQSSARIANLFLQYEQQEFEHLGYVLRSTYRYMIKKQQLNKPETIILSFLKAAIKFTSQNQLLEALKELKQQFTPYITEPLIVDFPLMEWIDSKLQKKELSEIVKDKYKEAVENELKEQNKGTREGDERRG